MLLEEVINEPAIHYAYYVNQNLPTIHAANMIAYTVDLYFLK